MPLTDKYLRSDLHCCHCGWYIRPPALNAVLEWNSAKSALMGGWLRNWDAGMWAKKSTGTMSQLSRPSWLRSMTERLGILGPDAFAVGKRTEIRVALRVPASCR